MNIETELSTLSMVHSIPNRRWALGTLSGPDCSWSTAIRSRNLRLWRRGQRWLAEFAVARRWLAARWGRSTGACLQNRVHRSQLLPWNVFRWNITNGNCKINSTMIVDQASKFCKIRDDFDADGQLDSIVPSARSNPTARRRRNHLKFYKILTWRRQRPHSADLVEIIDCDRLQLLVRIGNHRQIKTFSSLRLSGMRKTIILLLPLHSALSVKSTVYSMAPLSVSSRTNSPEFGISIPKIPAIKLWISSV